MLGLADPLGCAWWERVYVEAGRSLTDRVGDAIRGDDDDADRSALPRLYLTALRQRIVLWDMRSTAFGSVFSADVPELGMDPAAAPRMQALAAQLADGLESVVTLAADSAYEPAVTELLQEVESRRPGASSTSKAGWTSALS